MILLEHCINLSSYTDNCTWVTTKLLESSCALLALCTSVSIICNTLNEIEDLQSFCFLFLSADSPSLDSSVEVKYTKLADPEMEASIVSNSDSEI